MQESFNLESPNYEKLQKLTIPNLHNSYEGASSKPTRTLCLATGNCCLEWLLSHMELSRRAGNFPWAWINIREMPSHKQAKAFANTAVALHVHTYLSDYKNYSYLPLAIPFTVIIILALLCASLDVPSPIHLPSLEHNLSDYYIPVYTSFS